MLVIPAIDLRGGRCVRLYQGDFAQETVYAGDPVEVAQQWAAQGATIIHVVDLDGAKLGQPKQLSIIEQMRAKLPATVLLELGGGLRELHDVAAAFAAGASRVVLGTAALTKPTLLREAIAAYGAEQVVLGLDARDGYVATAGWLATSAVKATALAKVAQGQGVQRLIYTDIARDGTLTEPNYAALQEMVQVSGMQVIASGGVARLEHLSRLADLGCEAAIVGKALYSGDLVLREFVVGRVGQ